MLNKTVSIVLYALPIVVMIGLIPLIKNDYVLSLVYLACIITLLFIKSEKNDLFAVIFGFIAITISEAFFVSTGVETFIRNTLFGLMPFWLPLLWAYAFLSIKRSLRILDR